MMNVFEFITQENIHKCETCVVQSGLALLSALTIYRLVLAETFAAAVAWYEERARLRKVKLPLLAVESPEKNETTDIPKAG